MTDKPTYQIMTTVHLLYSGDYHVRFSRRFTNFNSMTYSFESRQISNTINIIISRSVNEDSVSEHLSARISLWKQYAGNCFQLWTHTRADRTLHCHSNKRIPWKVTLPCESYMASSPFASQTRNLWLSESPKRTTALQVSRLALIYHLIQITNW